MADQSSVAPATPLGRPSLVDPSTRTPVLALSNTPGHLLRRAQQVHTALWSRRLRGELTGPQYGVLVALATEPDADQTRVGFLAGVDPNTLLEIVRRLVAHGWVSRAPDPLDRRRRRLRLTASATTALRYITPAAATVQKDLFTEVPRAQRKDLIEMLAAVAFGTGDAPPAPLDTMPVLTMATTPGYLIRRAQQVHTTLWAEVVGAEVTGPQYAVLAALAVHRGLDQVSLGRHASLDRSTIAEVIARLAASGWVRREVNDKDARRQVLDLAPGARTRLRSLTPRAQRVQTRLLEPLPADRVDQFIHLLSLVAYSKPTMTAALD